jgi:hypothetical protein
VAMPFCQVDRLSSWGMRQPGSRYQIRYGRQARSAPSSGRAGARIATARHQLGGELGQLMPSLAPARAHADARSDARSDARPGTRAALARRGWPSSGPRTPGWRGGEGRRHRDERATGAGAAARPGPGPYAGSVPPPGIPPRHGLACHPHRYSKFLYLGSL